MKRCKRCYGHRTGRLRGVVALPQTHPQTRTRHRCVPTWTGALGWGFWSLCGVPIIFWRPETHGSVDPEEEDH